MIWVRRATAAVTVLLLQLSLVAGAAPCRMHGARGGEAQGAMQMDGATMDQGPAGGCDTHANKGCRGPSSPDGCASMTCTMILALAARTSPSPSVELVTSAISRLPTLKLGFATAPELPPPRI